jgi:hypothetical protein
VSGGVGHNHISAITAVARKLAYRAWAIATTGPPCEPRDLDGNPLTLTDAADLAAEYAVGDDARAHSRGHPPLQRVHTP